MPFTERVGTRPNAAVDPKQLLPVNASRLPATG